MSLTVNGFHLIGTDRSGVGVYVNLIRSLAAEHISHQPQLLTLAKELLSSQTISGEVAAIEHDFGRTIGGSEVVETTEKDTIVYAKRLKHETFSRFVRKRQLKPTSFLSMSLKKWDDGSYEVSDIWFGRQMPAFPLDETATAESKSFWKSHAFVFEGQLLQFRTLTKEAPY